MLPPLPWCHSLFWLFLQNISTFCRRTKVESIEWWVRFTCCLEFSAGFAREGLFSIFIATFAWKIKILYLHHSYLLVVATTGSNYPFGFTYSLFIQKHTLMRIFREAFLSNSMISKYKFLACSYKLEKFFGSILKLSSTDTTGWIAAT